MSLEPEDFLRLRKLPSRRLWDIIYAYSTFGFLGTTALRLLPLREETLNREIVITQILLGTAIICFPAGAFFHRLGDNLRLPDVVGVWLLLVGKTVKYLGASLVVAATITAPWESVLMHLWGKLWQ